MTQASEFGKFIPGFDFLQSLAGQAASGAGQGLPRLPSLSSWVAPTFNVEELEKRIGELKAVHFWLDQNAKALAATIQALEVQKMTLATLKTMNFKLGDVADALKAGPIDAAAAPSAGKTPFAGLEVPERTYGSPAAQAPASRKAPVRKAVAKAGGKAAAAPGTAADAPAGGAVDPVQWWGALSQQFQQIAAHAVQDMAEKAASVQATPAATAPARAKAAARTGASAATKTTARRRKTP